MQKVIADAPANALSCDLRAEHAHGRQTAHKAVTRESDLPAWVETSRIELRPSMWALTWSCAAEMRVSTADRLH